MTPDQWTPDQWIRTVFAFVVMASCYGWAVSIRMNWARWADDPRNRAVSLSLLPILILNAVGIVRAATLDQPVTWVTWSLLVSYLALNAAMWWPQRKP